MNTYIPADKLIAEIERQQRKLTLLSYSRRVDMRRDCALQNGVYVYILSIITSLQREQPEVDLEKELDQWRHKHFNGKRDGDYNGEYLERKSQLDLARHFYGLRNLALEEAARHVYESWMGGTMDDVRRDMVGLGKVLNERKEDAK